MDYFTVILASCGGFTSIKFLRIVPAVFASIFGGSRMDILKQVYGSSTLPAEVQFGIPSTPTTANYGLHVLFK